MSDLSQEASEAIAQYLNDLHAGICPTCKAKIEEEQQIGRCVYALPCGHRLFQGRAKRKEQQEQEREEK